MIAVYMAVCIAALVADRCARAHDRWAALTDDATEEEP